MSEHENADVIMGLRSFLLADADVADMVDGERIFGEEMPPEETALMEQTPHQCAVIKSAGGMGDPGSASRMDFTTPRLDIFCYGATPLEAAALELAVYRAMKQMTTVVHANVRLYDAVVQTGKIALRDPEKQWPFVFRSYGVSHADVART